MTLRALFLVHMVKCSKIRLEHFSVLFLSVVYHPSSCVFQIYGIIFSKFMLVPLT